MIKIQMKRYGKSVEVPVITSTEDVYLALWKLGLDRDMAKYTLEGLEAVFLYDTPLEHQMIRTISSTMKLQEVLYVLNHLTTPPEPIAMQLWEDLRDGYCHTSGFAMREIQRMVEEEAVEKAIFTFPIIGELVDTEGYVTEAPAEILAEYQEMIDAAFRKMQIEMLCPMTVLFGEWERISDILLSAVWNAEEADGALLGKVTLLLNTPLDEDMVKKIAEHIEYLNGMVLVQQLKKWSVLTDQGMLFIDLCDEGGDYAVTPLEWDELEDEEMCLCPDCMAKLKKGTDIEIELEEANEAVSK